LQGFSASRTYAAHLRPFLAARRQAQKGAAIGVTFRRKSGKPMANIFFLNVPGISVNAL
jgi:hypothetical protein